MPPQEVGVRAIFDVQQFNAGLRRYIKGLQDAAKATAFTVAALNQLATGFNTALGGQTGQINAVSAALQQMAASARQATRATRQATGAGGGAGAPTGGAANQAVSAAQQQLEIARLLKAEIKDRISLQKQEAILADRSSSALARAAALAESDIIHAQRALRDDQAVNLTLPQSFLDNIRQATVELQDLGNATKNQARDLAAEYRLLSEEVRDRVRSEQLIRDLQGQNISQLQRENALLELQQIAVAQIARTRSAQATGDPALLARLARIQTAPVTDKDLGVENQALENDLRITRLISDALRDRITLAKTVATIADKNATDAQRESAAIQQTNLLLERQRRLAELVRLGGDPAKLDAANKVMVTAIDLGKRANDDLLKQVEIQNLIQAEIAARIELEKANLVIGDKQTTLLQRQAALARIQTLELERQIRTRAAQQAGIPADNVNAIRNAAVATRDLGVAQQRTSASTQGLTTATVALGSALGALAAQAITRVVSGLFNAGRTILETVTFFERLELSIGFYAARSLGAAAATLNYQEKIAATAQETEGLAFWLQRLAVSSPFTTRDVGTLFRTSQAYGLLRNEAEVLTPLLLDFAAAAGLDSDILERLALAIGQVRARGKLTGEEIRQLGNSGIPIRDILVETLGIANEQFDELVESGSLTSDIVIPAIIKALKQFEGAGEAVAFGTIGGIVSAFKELQEIGTSKFFRAALEPLKESLQEFFKIANDPSSLAFVTVLGEEVGVRLASALERARAAVMGAIDAFNRLDPAVVQQTVVFVGATAAILAAAAAFGLLVTAIGFVTQPLVGLTLTMAFLVSEWTSGWAVIRSITSSAANAIGGMLASMAQWGADTARQWGAGFAKAGSIVAEFAAIVRDTLTFWFMPGSPPRVAPDIDDWGRQTGQVYLDAFAKANPETPFNKLGEVVERGLVDATIAATKKQIDKYNELNQEFQVSLSRELNAKTASAYGVIVKNATEQAFEGAVEAAGEAGIQAGEAYINAFGYMVRRLTPIIAPELQEAIRQLGAGRQLSAAGALAFGKFLEGFKEADFGILDEAAGVIEGFLQSMVDQGDLSEGDMLVRLFGAREDIAAAIQEFRRVGSISESTMRRIVESAGGAGESVRELLVAYQEFARTDDILTAAQDRLTAITKQYVATLKPLREELERISAARQASDEDQEILSLKRLISNAAVSEFRKENARLKIAEILQGRKVRGIENEQEAQEEAAQAEIDAAAERQKAAQEQLALVQAQINAQLGQLSLVGQEAQVMKQLAEEIKKLRESQKTELDLQLELLKLQKAELGDAEKAAKAKYILDKADSTEMERQNAILDLQEVALGRQQRLIEARKLGIPEEELTKLYNFQVTLSDIGIKAKDDLTGLGEGLDGLTESTVKAKEEAMKWQEELRKARVKIDEIKESLRLMFEQINNNLPAWLKIFPEEEGGTPAIVTTLETYKWAILGVGAAIIASKILAGLGGIVSFFTILGGGATVAGSGGSAAVGVRAIGAALGALWAIGRVVLPIITTISTVVVGAALALAKLFNFLEQREWGKIFIKMLDAQSRGIGAGLDMGDLDAPAEDMFGGDIFTNPLEGLPEPDPTDLSAYQDALRDTVFAVVSQGVKDGLSETDINGEVVAAINKGIADGTLPDQEVTAQAATDFMNQLIRAYKAAGEIKSPSALSGREIGTPFGEGILEYALAVFAPGSDGANQVAEATAALVKLVVDGFAAMRRGVAVQVRLLRKAVLDVFVGGEANLGLADTIQVALMGDDGLRPYLLGVSYMQMLATGIAAGQQTVADAMVSAMQFALGEAQAGISVGGQRQTTGPSGNDRGRFMQPIAAQHSSRPSTAFAQGVTNITTYNEFNLSVTSTRQSQGVINDFGIMQTMAGA